MSGKESSAIIVVDVQPKFIGNPPQGARDGEKIVPVIARILEQKIFPHVIVACHFWELGKPESQPHLDLRLDVNTVFVHKHDGSAFDGYVYKAQRKEKEKFYPENNLETLLRQRKIDNVWVCGIFTEFCVQSTAVDAHKKGFRTHVIVPACAGTEDEGLAKDAIESMSKAGIEICSSDFSKAEHEEKVKV